jgi:hypothetical protein
MERWETFVLEEPRELETTGQPEVVRDFLG